jgi:hypothetical protein
MVSPIPLPAPVTIATLSAKRMRLILLVDGAVVEVHTIDIGLVIAVELAFLHAWVERVAQTIAKQIN